MAVVEGFSLFDLAQKGIKDPPRGESRCQRHIPAGEPFCQTQKVGNDLLLLTGKHRPRSPEACHHLVENQKHTGLVAFLAEGSEHSLRPCSHAGRALDQRLDHDSRHIAMLESRHRIEFLRGVDARHREPVAGQISMKGADAPQARRAQRVAVVGVLK